MNSFIVMACIGFVVYWVYTGVVFKFFGIPESYSNTFYLWNEKVNGLGWIFPAVCVLTVAMVMPGWLEVSDILNSNLSVLCFFGGGGLLFVAAAPFFKEYTYDTGRPLIDLLMRHLHGQGLVHMIGALLAMICTTVWCALNPLWWIEVMVLAVTIVAMLVTRSWKSVTFWVELFVFNTIYLTVLTYYCIL
jgi:lysylphosphatidylglycerol synthetase-like protein (DUF2156 family)